MVSRLTVRVIETPYLRAATGIANIRECTPCGFHARLIPARESAVLVCVEPARGRMAAIGAKCTSAGPCGGEAVVHAGLVAGAFGDTLIVIALTIQIRAAWHGTGAGFSHNPGSSRAQGNEKQEPADKGRFHWLPPPLLLDLLPKVWI